MARTKIKVDNNSGLGYFPKEIRDEGFVGELEGFPNAVTLTLLKPGTTWEQARDSLKIMLRDLDLRISVKLAETVRAKLAEESQEPSKEEVK